MKNVFEPAVSTEFISRINQLTPQTQALWGKMNISQMLAHCNVTYELAYENKHPEPNAFVKLMLKLFVKSTVVTDKAYSKGMHTAKFFIINDERNFETEKNRLQTYIQKTQQLGPQYFEGRVSHSFGTLKSSEWNVMFYKHLNHHLEQFGV
ncbi:DUF1569 domain-containing protein [Adhaeribacter terreus]|uniref:DUF1569 domain-containing protein n=1 Tax=Adhaeribacter terreus TaxID=529703 RepID=A0ABW0EBB7_9BACT